MRIGIDGTSLTLPFHSGTRHYAEQLLTNLARFDHKNEYVIFATKKISFLDKKNFKTVIVPQNMPFLKRQIFLPRAANREKLDLFHYLEPFGSYVFRHPRIITTVHDLELGTIHPKVNSPKTFIRRWYPEVIRHGTLQNTHTFIAVSEWTKRELDSYMHRYNLKSKIHVIYEACNPAFRQFPKNKDKKEHYFLCMGDFSPRKNISRILKAFSEFQKRVKKSYRLKIIVSTHSPVNDFVKHAKELGVELYVDIHENVPLRELIELYNDALVFVYPSLYEGFGIPILEAMACGCPVITSNYGAVREVAGEAALLVNPEDTQDIFRAMHDILENKKITYALRQAGLERARQFSWEQTARKTLSVYEVVYML